MRPVGSAIVFVAMLIFLGTVFHCGVGADTARSGDLDITLVRQLTAGSGLIELSSRGQLAVLTGRGLTVIDPVSGDTLVALIPPAMLGDEVTGQALAFSGDGGLLAATTNSSLVVFDLDWGTEILRRTYPVGHVIWNMGALTFTPDNGMLLVGGQISPVMVLDCLTGDIVDSLGGRMYVSGISILPDESLAAVATFGGDVIIWDWTGGEMVDTLTGCGSWCNAIASTDSFLAASCGPDSIRVWDSHTLHLRGMIGGYRYIGLGFSVGRSGYLVAGSGPGTPDPPEGVDASEILLFDLTTLEPVASWSAHSPTGVYDTAMTPDGALIATCGYDGIIDVWKFKSP